jgi:transcriptional regulator with XRE-family HTH domain
MASMADTIEELFGRRVRILRQTRGWRQDDLAAEASISRNHIGAIERAEREVCLRIIGQLAKALGVAPTELLR